VQGRYKDLYADSTLADLPARYEGPDIVITATNLATGTLFRFRRRGVGDFHRHPDDTSTRFFQAPTIPLGLAVATSSAFPPVLSPCILDASAYPSARAAQRKVYLTDCGIYDNPGIEPLDDAAHKIVLSSDGGAPFKAKPKPPVDYQGGMVHILKVVDLQGRKPGRSELVEWSGQERHVAYWAINSELSKYVAAASKPGAPTFEVLEVSGTARREMAAISTRLAALQTSQQHRLVNWGYSACDAALRAYVMTTPRGQFPYQGVVG
jgi:NTE family protein